jgi:hypothetical protein
MLALAALAVVGHLVGLTPLPPLPRGTWSCAMSGEFMGTLSVEGPRYVFTSAETDEAGAGAFATANSRLGRNSRSGLIRVWSGPLKDTFGVSLGLHNRGGDPETLVFNMGPGKGLQCLRA